MARVGESCDQSSHYCMRKKVDDKILAGQLLGQASVMTSLHWHCTDNQKGSCNWCFPGVLSISWQKDIIFPAEIKCRGIHKVPILA